MRLPLFAGYIANVRAARAADGGARAARRRRRHVPGHARVEPRRGRRRRSRAYNAIGYAAAAIGNHEFDFGPVGPAVTRARPARIRAARSRRAIAEAKFPFLVAEHRRRGPARRSRGRTSSVDDRRGRRASRSASSARAPSRRRRTTMPANFAGLAMTPAAQTRSSPRPQALRAAGRAGRRRRRAHRQRVPRHRPATTTPSSCDTKDELFTRDRRAAAGPRRRVRRRPHARGVAHRIDGVAAIESYSSGRAFGRVDVRIAGGRVARRHDPRADARVPARQGQQPGAGRRLPSRAIRGQAGRRRCRRCRRSSTRRSRARASAATRSSASTLAGDDDQGVRQRVGRGRLVHRSDARGAPRCRRRADERRRPARGYSGGRADVRRGCSRRCRSTTGSRSFDVNGKHVRRLLTSNLQRGGGILSWGGLTREGALQRRQARRPRSRSRASRSTTTATYTIVTSDFLASAATA